MAVLARIGPSAKPTAQQHLPAAMIGPRDWSPCSSFPNPKSTTARAERANMLGTGNVDFPATFLARNDRTGRLGFGDETSGYPKLRPCTLYRGLCQMYV